MELVKWFVLDGLHRMVCHCGVDGMDHDGGIVATVCHSAMTVIVSHGSMRVLVCHGQHGCVMVV